ncbi:MAG: RES family NAD+ phosphorylase [Terriglobales bacterium]
MSRKPDPWAPLDWSWAEPDGTFANRFDDPESKYRVLYASSQKLGCFLETLARYRQDPNLLAELSDISGDDDFFPLGEVPYVWIEGRLLGSATIDGDYADVGSSEMLNRLRVRLAGRFAEFGIDDFDASILQRTSPRSLTQAISRIIYGAGSDGIYYRSKHGHDIENWALFEPFKIVRSSSAEIHPDDPALQEALRLYSIRLQKRKPE